MRPLQLDRGRVNQVGPPLLQLGVLLPGLHRDLVQCGVPEHPDVEVGVAQPVRGVLHSLHRAQQYLGVHHVWKLGHQMGLYGQLLAEQRQVVLQLRVVGDQDALALGVVLRSAGPAQHLEHVEGG